MNDYYEALKAAGVVRKAKKQDLELKAYLSRTTVKVAVMEGQKLHEVVFDTKAQANKYIKSTKLQEPYFRVVEVI